MATENVRDIYITALQNTHALEQEALQIMERQVERLERYPEMEQALRRHIQETHEQRRRIEEALNELGESTSSLKEAVLGFMGNMAAVAHTPAQDEILKNTFANHAFENYEIAAYRSLLVFAESAGAQRHLTGFQQSLREEQDMAQRVSEQIEAVTRRYLSLTTGGEASAAKI
jgi:ferritin-like metal-binding protein YciE